MTKTTHVTIIYNPNSTGGGKENAEKLQAQLEARGLTTILIRETEYAGHALKLAQAVAEEQGTAMVISSSGDGGYHEVINGVLTSKKPTLLTGVLPSGNANDHYHFVHRGDTAERIINGDEDVIDLIKITTPKWTKYAHSYAGLGMTPQIGEVLTKAKLNPVRETWLVVTNLFKVRSVKVRMNGRASRYDHVVFSNIGHMSKYLTLSEDASVTDGKIELTKVRSRSFINLLRHLLHAAVIGEDEAPQAERYELQLLNKATIQLDGEVYGLDRGDKIVVECAPRMLHCIV